MHNDGGLRSLGGGREFWKWDHEIKSIGLHSRHLQHERYVFDDWIAGHCYHDRAALSCRGFRLTLVTRSFTQESF